MNANTMISRDSTPSEEPGAEPVPEPGSASGVPVPRESPDGATSFVRPGVLCSGRTPLREVGVTVGGIAVGVAFDGVDEPAGVGVRAVAVGVFVWVS
jgi:hypothetical protein